jgi:hypothetical protein
MRLAMRVATASAALALAGLGVSACGGSSSPPSTTASSTTTTSSSATTSSSSPTTSTSTTSTTAAVAVCRASQLSMAKAGGEGAAGTQELTFSLTNSSSSLCTMRGYPGMLLLSSSGAAEPTTVDRGGGFAFENVAVSTVSLAPGKTAYFNLGYSDVTAIPPQCSTADSVEITPPTATTHGVVAVSNIQACANGTLHVSAVFGATDATATATTAPAG